MSASKLHPNFASTIREKIEIEMSEGRYLPGDLLDEKALAERYGVSRTPVREAIQQLLAQGLVYKVARQGAFVSKLSSKELLALVEMLSYMEGLCAMLSARRSPTETVAELMMMVEACEHAAQQNDREAFATANAEFHRILYASTRNAPLAQQVMALRRRSQLYRRNIFHQPGRMAKSAAEHRQIVELIATQDENGAFRAAVDHIAVAGQSFAEFVMTLPDESLADSDRTT
ncbi:GntR family transcriptional regulator [Pseudomonas agarici]|uniref:GntR family transcriptional regulator n=1 Tax=Pseudomonas agarici TaxID=46677 RepID=UPI00031B56AB|nr:GntR family transcriptional regulator [Pseudomonas agarici]NWC07678.1 GntR family transcriptional regulator [Pseudomonas agarici]SEL76479.1 transcriptional regulator, GntR family [Pseudomonas agarici]